MVVLCVQLKEELEAVNAQYEMEKKDKRTLKNQLNALEREYERVEQRVRLLVEQSHH